MIIVIKENVKIRKKTIKVMLLKKNHIFTSFNFCLEI
jgi:hypothetical protein